MTTQLDQKLVIRLQSGDLEALGLIYSRYYQMVYRTAYAISGDGEAASDLSQDVFLRLHRFAGLIDCQRPLKPWLYRMTANLTYDWVKRNRRGLSLLKEVAERIWHNFEPISLQEVAEDKAGWRQVEQSIFSLPLPQRVVVVLHYLNDFSVQEMAEILDIPEGTVKSRLHYGRQALKTKLKMLGFEGPESLSGLKYGRL